MNVHGVHKEAVCKAVCRAGFGSPMSTAEVSMRFVCHAEIARVQALAQEAVRALGGSTFAANRIAPAKALVICTILDGMFAVVALLQSPGQGHVFTLLRSLLEAFADLEHLDTPEGELYLHRMRLTSALRKKRQGEELIAARLNDPASMEIIRVAKEACRDAKRVIDSARANGAMTEITPTERVAALGQDAAGLYTQYCFDAHNDLDALIRRHATDDRELLELGGNLDEADVLNVLGLTVFLGARSLAHVLQSAASTPEHLAGVLSRFFIAEHDLTQQAHRATRKRAGPPQLT